MEREMKKDIKKAITTHSKKYTATKVWGAKIDEYYDGSIIMRIEVSLKKKK